jgi:hypothetical protein
MTWSQRPLGGCTQHTATDPPNVACIACKYLCGACGRWDGSVRRWIDDATEFASVTVCDCVGGPQVVARHWHHAAVVEALRRLR